MRIYFRYIIDIFQIISIYIFPIFLITFINEKYHNIFVEKRFFKNSIRKTMPSKKKEEDFLQKWNEIKKRMDPETVTDIHELSKKLDVPENDIEKIAIEALKQKMDEIDDIYTLKKGIMKEFCFEELVFNEIAKKAGFRTTKTKIYTDIKQEMLLRLDPVAWDYTTECIGIYGDNRTAVIRRMIIDFYTNHLDEIEKVYNR